jgi:hypothetical protein
MYCGVPTTIPLMVSDSVPAAWIARAIPKSVTTACPAESMTFSGFTSR